MRSFSLLIISVIVVVTKVQGQGFKVPEALVEPLQPKGFRVSIPNLPGIKLFAFHGKLNEELEGREGGTFSRDIVRAKDGRWTFTDKITKLKIGDILYYWTYVDYFDGERTLGYTNDDQKFVVTKFVNAQQQPTAPPTIVTKVPFTNNNDNNGCAATSTLVKGKSSCSGKLVFQENFNNNFLTDLNRKWEVTEEFADAPDYEFVLYSRDSRNIYTNHNMLFIKPTLLEEKYGEGFVNNPQGLDLGINCTKTPGTVHCSQKPQSYLILPPVLSARVNTKDQFWFTYGTVEIRAKLPKGDWIYPELFLNPKRKEYGKDYESGQIRIAFVPGNYDLNRNLSAGAIFGSSQHARNFAMRSQVKSNGWSDDYHVYSVKWEPNLISLLVDGEIYGTIEAPEGGFARQIDDPKVKDTLASRLKLGSEFAPFDHSMYITIGVGVGGHSFPDNLNNKPWINNDPKGQKNFFRAKEQWFSTWGTESVLHVDYVRVYAL